MKTDNKEEAKRYLNQFTHLPNTANRVYFQGEPFEVHELMSDFHNHMKDQDRFHPETLERVVKPERKNERDAPTFSEKMEFVKWMKETITLDQLIERCKEMRTRIDRWLH